MSGHVWAVRGPWLVRAAFSGNAAHCVYRSEERTEVVAAETHDYLALLRDAITEYLQAVEANR